MHRNTKPQELAMAGAFGGVQRVRLPPWVSFAPTVRQVPAGMAEFTLLRAFFELSGISMSFGSGVAVNVSVAIGRTGSHILGAADKRSGLLAGSIADLSSRRRQSRLHWRHRWKTRGGRTLAATTHCQPAPGRPTTATRTVRSACHRGVLAIAFLTGLTSALAALPARPSDALGTDPSASGAGSTELPAELRARVVQLIRDVETDVPVADAEALYERASVLYAWAGAFRARDPIANDIPWNLPSTVAAISRARYAGDDTAATAQLARGAAAIADYVRQLRLREEDPRAIGHARLVDDAPLTAAALTTIEILYTVGSKPLAEGATLALGTHNASGIRLQTADPTGEDYATAVASRDGVQLRAPRAERGQGGLEDPGESLTARRPLTTFTVTGGGLAPGDTVLFRLGDRRSGGPGARVQSFSNDFVPLEVTVQFERDGTAHTLPRLGLEVLGGPAAGVTGFAPSVLAPGERFTLAVRTEDAFTNRATGPIPAYRVALNGQPFLSIPGGDSAIVELEGLALDEPGVYRFAIESLDGAISGLANPVLVEAAPTRRIYWGETHGHSGMAEGQGTSDAYFEFGRDDARLDFLVHSEHDIWMDEWEWEELRANTLEFSAPGRFVTFLGYEWTVDQSFGGHHNVVFRSPQGRQRVPQQTHPTLAQLYQGLRERHAARDVLIIPHAHQAGDWRMNDPGMERLVEIQSNHGVFEWFGHMYLQQGHHIGFVSASDDHRSHPGYGVSRGRRSGLAAVIAPEKTADALFDAMKGLQTYAVSGDRILLDVRLGETPMGRIAPVTGDATLQGRVIGTSPIDRITILENSNRVVWQGDLRTRTGAIGAVERVEVNVASDSTPTDMRRDNPRGGRSWDGTIEVHGAKIAAVNAPGFVDVLTQGWRIDPDNPQRVHFRTWTRGNHSSVMLDLEGAGPGTRIEVRTAPTIERQGNFTRLRGVVEIPAFEAGFDLAEALAAAAVRTQPVEGYEDRISLRRVLDDAPMEQTFGWTPEAPARPGDYYTVRVEQENDQLAWSSPIWVGGYAVRSD